MKKKVLKRLVRYTKPYSRYIAGALVFAVLFISLSLYVPVLIGQAVDCMNGKGAVQFPNLLHILLILGISIALSAFFQWLMNMCTNVVTYRTVRDLRNETYEKLHAVPLKYIDGHPHGDLVSRIVNDADQVSDGLLQGIKQLFTGVTTIIGTLVFMLTISPLIAAVVVLVTPLSLFVAGFIAKLSNGMFKKQQELQGQLGSCIEEMVGNQKVVKAFSYEKRSQARFEGINARLQAVGEKAQFYSSLSNPSTRFVNAIVYASVGIIGSLYAIAGHMSVGQIASFLAYANQYTKPFNEVTGVLTQIQTAFAGAQRIFEVLDAEPETADSPDAAVLPKDANEISVNNVTFSYNPAVTLIEELNGEARKGQRIAIGGPTGCGKTTLINLLMRFYDPQQGSFYANGIPITELEKKAYRRHIGMVLQDTWIFAGTVYENIAYAKPSATREEVEATAQKAQAAGFIEGLPKGYETPITDSSGLSLGEKQLLCVARVMLLEPEIVILDEATSNIDVRTEALLTRSFAILMEGKTSLVVAHRLSTIASSDLIVVMKEGAIIEQGNHQELLAEKGFYYSLYNAQFE
jgi:ATP-binding cassette subfamily B protein